MSAIQAQIQQAVARQRAGDVAGAEAALRGVLAAAPGMPMASALLGRLLSETGRAEEAERMLAPIAAADPGRPLVRQALGMALNRLGRPEEAVEHFAAASAMNPGDVQARFWHGATLERLDRREESTAVFREAIRAASGDARALVSLGERLHTLERHELCAECYERAVGAGAEGGAVRLRLASALQSLRRYPEALEQAEKAAELQRNDPAAWMVIADIHEKSHRLEEATAAAQRGLELQPGHTVLSRILARLERRAGRPERGEAITRGALDAGVKDDRLLAPLLIERGHALDALGRYDEALDAFERGKSAWLETVRERYPLERFAGELDRRRAAVDVAARRRAELGGADAETGTSNDPVFFVGFPRSGTTLMEQVLAAHPGIVTMDEAPLLDRPVMQAAARMTGARGEDAVLGALDASQLGELRQAYLEAAAEALGAPIGGRLLVDKLPLNLTRIGLIRLLFPGARVLVALRDPRDCCLSGLMQSFDANEAMVHFHSMESAARLYASVMDIWLAARGPIGEPFLEYRYEELTADFEGTVRRVLGFLGLEWREEVLRFQERARERAISTPSYQRVVSAVDRGAVARWRRYGDRLGSAIETLRPYAVELGYEG